MGVVQKEFIQDRTIGSLDSSESHRLTHLFKSNYRVVRANTNELVNEAYRIRYEVYCEENAFESKHRFKDRLEQDEFDHHSNHYLIQELITERYVGTIRLIKSQSDDSVHCLPVEKFCSHAFHDSAMLPSLKPGYYAEISRLAVTSCSRINLLGTLAGKYSNEQINRLGYSVASIALAYCCLAEFQLNNRLSHAITMMEPRLAVLLSRMGIKFKRVGKPIEYHGLRAPYIWVKNGVSTDFTPDQLSLFNSVYEALR